MEKKQLNADYQRIAQVMSHLNYSSDKSFADAIGVSPQNLYDIKAGKKGVTQFIADAVIEHYPQFNRSFLMFGDGEMIVSAPIQITRDDNNHHHVNNSDARYIAHLEAEIELLRKEKEQLWEMVQKLIK